MSSILTPNSVLPRLGYLSVVWTITISFITLLGSSSKSYFAAAEPTCTPQESKAQALRHKSSTHNEPQSTRQNAVSSSSLACLGIGPKQPNPTSPRIQDQDMNQPHSKESPQTQALSPRGDRNVLGEPLQQCCTSPLTGFERDGFCHTGPHDRGIHVVCAEMTEAFLEYTRARGNDLSTPIPRYGFPGLKPGDRWCLCAARWAEAERAGVAPPVHLEATQEKALTIIPLDVLKKYALKQP